MVLRIFYSCARQYKAKEEAKACNVIQKESLAQLFPCEFCESSKNTFFYRPPPVAASE